MPVTPEAIELAPLKPGFRTQSNAFALRVLSSDGTAPATKYYSFDHLGSVTAMSDEVGHVPSVAEAGPNAGVLGYDPWGSRRSPDGRAADPATFNLQVGHREFTGHEAIPSINLVNMNGRIYDPELGRFLTPDPNVQFVSNLQSYNRYSYVQNNPLRYTDPTGYFLGLHNNFATWLDIGEIAVSIGVCAATDGVGCLVIGLQLAVNNAMTALLAGAPVGQTLGLAAAGLTVGFLTGGVGAELGGGLMAAVIGGAASGAATAAIGNLVTGQSLGRNLLDSAIMGAVTAAAGWGVQTAIAPSQASAETVQGGSGEGRAERLALDGNVSSQDLDDKVDDAKLDAVLSGNVVSAKIGGLEVDIYGGDASQQEQALDALRTDLTETARGRVILDQLVNGPGADAPLIRPYDIVILEDTGVGSFTYPAERLTVFDPSDLQLRYYSDPGTNTFSYERIFAHEMGHLVGGSDIGDTMQNINTNENPIMRELGDPFDRTRLEIPDFQ